MSEPIQADPSTGAPEEPEYSTQSDFPRTSSDPDVESDDSRGSTRSLKSAQELIVENGRYYCNDIYFMPCDETEQTRLMVAYQIYLFMLDHKITLGVIPQSPKRILDVGAGTGDWAMAAAERFPEATVVALDITDAYFPGAMPPNVTFELDNAEHEWTHNEPFDFIHIRELGGAFSDWSKIYSEAAKHLKNGGMIEVADHNRVFLTNEPKDSWLSIFNGAVHAAGENAGRPLNLDHLKKPMFDKAGLSITKSRTFDLPVGQWHPDPRKKVVSKMALVAALDGIEATGLRLLTKYQEYSEEDARSLIEKVREEVKDPEAKAYIKIQFVVARKMGL